jgi:hypothetical protein
VKDLNPIPWVELLLLESTRPATTLNGMGKVWVLDTETKGTGANVVPLEKVQRKRSAADERAYIPRKPRPRPAPEQAPPRRFKVVDLMTRQALIEDASTRATVDVLKGVRSIVDVNVYVWEPERDDWRLLTLDEKRTVWDFRDR